MNILKNLIYNVLLLLAYALITAILYTQFLPHNFIFLIAAVFLAYIILYILSFITSSILLRKLTEIEWQHLKDSILYHGTENKNANSICNDNIGDGKVFLRASQSRAVNFLSFFKPSILFYISLPNEADIKYNSSLKKADCYVKVKLTDLNKKYVKISRFNSKVIVYTNDYVGNGSITA